MRRDNPDRNAKELLENLEKEGWSCCRIARAVQKKKGVPDSVVSRKGSKRNHLLEIKNLGGRLSEEQVTFAREWPGCVHVATNSFEANLMLKECEDRSRMSTRDLNSQLGAAPGQPTADRPAFSYVDPKDVKRSPECCGCPSFPYALCFACHRYNYPDKGELNA